MAKEKKTPKPNGRPKGSTKYTDEQLFQKKIEEYFTYCDETFRPYTMSGLAYALDLDRKTLISYGKDDRFSPLVKKAKDRVQAYVEEKLFKSGIATGVIFNLKNNFGWVDEKDYNLSGNVNNPYEKLTEDELRKMVDGK